MGGEHLRVSTSGSMVSTHEPSLERDRVHAELLHEVQLVVHVLQQTQHLKHKSRAGPRSQKVKPEVKN